MLAQLLKFRNKDGGIAYPKRLSTVQFETVKDIAIQMTEIVKMESQLTMIVILIPAHFENVATIEEVADDLGVSLVIERLVEPVISAQLILNIRKAMLNGAKEKMLNTSVSFMAE